MGAILDGAIAVRVGAISARDGAVAGAAEGAYQAAKSALTAARADTAAVYQAALDAQAQAANETIRELKRQLTAARESIAERDNAILVRDANAVGLAAQRDALRDAGPRGHELYNNSGVSFVDGSPKTRIRLIYEQRFDHYLAERGISSPHSLRKN